MLIGGGGRGGGEGGEIVSDEVEHGLDSVVSEGFNLFGQAEFLLGEAADGGLALGGSQPLVDCVLDLVNDVADLLLDLLEHFLLPSAGGVGEECLHEVEFAVEQIEIGLGAGEQIVVPF